MLSKIKRSFLVLTIFFLSNFSSRALLGEENFLLIDGATDKNILVLGSIDTARVTPCSTFKIALSLMGFDSAVLENKEVPVWDFQEGDSTSLDFRKSSQTPESWMKTSCVWFSQILTSKLGLQEVQKYLCLFDYGNQDMTGGLTKAWLSSTLKISLIEQVDFLQKMIRSDLPVSSHAIQMTKSLLFLEELPGGWSLFGKTGLGRLQEDNSKEVGWFVGWIEKGEDIFVFAYNIQDTKVDCSLRLPRVKQLIAKAHIMDTQKDIDKQKN